MSHKQRTEGPFALSMIGLLLALLLPSGVSADTFIVSNLNDAGAGSFRQAMLDAEANPGFDRIEFTAAGTINLQSAVPTITESIFIAGPGASQITVRRDDAAPAFRIFNIAAGSYIATIRDITISNGLADFGGGISTDTDLVVQQCVISDNTATVNGGGIDMSPLLSYASIESCTFVGNTAGSTGGALHYTGGSNPPLCCEGLVTSSTITGNRAPFGAGIAVSAFSGLNALLRVENSTITENLDGGGGIRSLVSSGQARVTLSNTIVSGNEGAELVTSGGGTFVTEGFNLLEVNQGVEGVFPAGSPNANDDQVGSAASPLDPLLLPLASNGGPTPTHALGWGSPAIDNGQCNSFADQRNQPRTLDGDGDGMSATDIGAFELRRYPVTTLADSGVGSLRQAILDNNVAGAGHVAIEIPGMIVLTNELAPVTKPVSIKGLGALQSEIHRNDAAPDFRFLKVENSGHLSIFGMTLSNGKAFGGGAILANGPLMVDSCVFRDNCSEAAGGAIGTDGSDSAFLVQNSTFVTNESTAFAGGAISYRFGGGPVNVGRIINSTFSGNDALSVGSAIIIRPLTTQSNLEILNCTLTENVSGSPGGAVCGLDTPYVVVFGNTIVANNTSSSSSPDLIALDSGNFLSLGGNIIGNHSGAPLSFPVGLPNGNLDYVGNSGSPVDPGLKPVGNYGGPTPTHALELESVAIDVGVGVPVLSGLLLPTTDQRGRPRAQDGDCDAIEQADSGAYEQDDCRGGNVNGGGGGTIHDTLFINGSAGAGVDRRISVGTGQSITIELQASQAGPASNARYFLYAWLGDSSSPTVFSAAGTPFGVIVNPGPIQGGGPQPFRCLRGTGISPAVCVNVPEITAPARAPFSLTDGNGVNNPNVKFTLQGLIEDLGSPNPLPFSVTNAVIVELF